MNETKRIKGMIPYGIGAATCTLSYVLISNLTYALTESFGMTSMVVGLIFLFSRLFDGVTDLIAGFIIDHTHTRWGKSRPYDLVQIPLWGFVVLCFSIPGSLSAVGKVIWVVVAYNMSQSVCYTLTACANNIRLKHYASEEKLPKVMSVGTIILTILGMGLNIIMPILIKIFENRPHGWTTLALLVSVPCMLGGVLRFFMLDEYAENPEAAKEAEKTEASKEKVSFKDIVKAFASNKSIWVVALFVFLPGLNNSFSVVGNYFFKYIFGDIAIAAIPMLVGAVLGLIFMAFYPAITKKIGNRNVAYLGFGMFLVGNAGKLVSLHNIIGLSILTASSLIGLLLVGAARQIMLFECMEYGKLKLGHEMEGIYASITGFADKIGLGIGSFLLGLIMQLGGYDGSLEVQTASGNAAIIFAYIAIPSIMAIAGIIAMRGYSADREVAKLKAQE